MRCLARVGLGGLLQALDGLLAHGLVEGHLAVAQLQAQGDLGARRQLAQDLALEPAQDEGAQQLPQALAGALVPMLFDGGGEAPVEALQGAEQAGIDEAEQVPQLAQVVLDGGAGGDHAKSRPAAA